MRRNVWVTDLPNFTPAGKSETKSIIGLLENRSLGLFTHAKQWQLPRMLWLSQARNLKPKFKKKLAKSFSVLHDGLFVARSCTDKSIDIHNTDGKALRQVSFEGQWKDAVLGVVNTLNVPGSSTYHFKPCLYILTSKDLLAVDMLTGAVMQTIRLNLFACKFVNLIIDYEARFIALRSTKSASNSNRTDPWLTFAFYDMPGLLFKRSLQVRKSVFGDTMVDVQISESMLLTMHRGEVIKLYNLDSCSTHECGPCLFTVNSLHNYLVIGGHPWSAITRSKGLFHVSDLVTGTKVDGPGLNTEEEESGSCQVIFHPDGSSRILLLHDASIQTFTMYHHQGKQLILAKGPCYSYASEPVSSPTTRVTSSGRTGRQCYYEGAERELQWSYEDELGLLAIVYGRECVTPRAKRAIVIDQVQICDSASGHVLRTFAGNESFAMDLDPYPWTLDLMVDGVSLLVSLQTRRHTYAVAYELAESRP